MPLDFTRPGKPTDNSYIKSFNGKVRDECLNVHQFAHVAYARRRIETWRIDDNEARPHVARGDPPRKYVANRQDHETRKTVSPQVSAVRKQGKVNAA